MAKICILSEEPPNNDHFIGNQSLYLANSLAECQHEVKVLTDYKMETSWIQNHNRVEVIRPFERWNLLEFPKVMAYLMRFQPDLIMTFQPQSKSSRKWWNILNVLPYSFPLHIRPKQALVIFDLSEFSDVKKSLRKILPACEFVLTCNVYQKQMISSLRETHKHQYLDFLPLQFPPKNSMDFRVHKECLPAEFPEKFIYFPGELHEHEDLLGLVKSLFESKENFQTLGFVFGGGWESCSLGLRKNVREFVHKISPTTPIYFTGPLGEQQVLSFIQNAMLTVVSTLKLSSFSHTHALQACHFYKVPVLMSQLQKQYDFFKWGDENLFFQTNRELKTTLNAIQKTVKTLPLGPSDGLDQDDSIGLNPGNIVTRLLQL